MQFGTKTTLTTTSGMTKMKVQKYHAGDETRNETIYEERVPISSIQEASTVFESMHITHALKSTTYGAWVEKNLTSGKLYVVKCWIENEK